MLNKSKLISGVVCLLITVSTVQAETTIFDANAVISDGDVYDNIVINGNNTVVDMTGGEITGSLFTYDNSTFNMTGGFIRNHLKSYQISDINLYGGVVEKDVDLSHSSRLFISDGRIEYTLINRDTSTCRIYSNAYINNLDIIDFSTANFYGGFVGNITITTSGTLHMYGGATRNGSIIRIRNDASAIISGGDYYNVFTDDNASATITGGGASGVYISLSTSSTQNIYSGNINYISAWGNSVLNLYGHDLEVSLIGGTEGYGEITGYLSDDTPIDADFLNQDAYLYTNLIEGTIPSPPPICTNHPFSDVNWDCKVDYLDFIIMVSEWLDCNLDPIEFCL